MKKPISTRIAAATGWAAICLCAQIAFGQAKLTIHADQPGHTVSTNLWGIFFEDINHSTDGGIYPELVRNRSFEDAGQPESWTQADGGTAHLTIDDQRPLNPFNRHNLMVQLDGNVALQNHGYWGMAFVAGERYRFKLAARLQGNVADSLQIMLKDAQGNTIAQGVVSGLNEDWKYYSTELTATATDPQGYLVLSGHGRGTMWLDMVSLMPEKTWLDHGLRPDLCVMLDNLQPAFMRFPGGCWVEGDDFAHMNHWKRTIGNIDTRTPLYNIWGYWATHGLGFYEYLQLAEDLHATPLFDINVGMSHHETVPMDQMGQWVQDALDAIEYANGPTNSVWGSLRAQAGHPAPFGLKLMEIGNENGGPDYAERWPLLVNAIRARYPAMQLIVNSDLRGRPYPKLPAPDFVDEHYYESPESFIARATQYDAYDRHGPKIFVGEYAVTSPSGGLGNLRAAVGEAAFMTGIERNSDIVAMACYAPLLVNMNHRAWNPDLINFDSSRVYGLPSYYVQLMFSRNRGDVTLPMTVDAPMLDDTFKSGGIGVGTWRTQAEFKDIKVTAGNGKTLFASDFSRGTLGWQLSNGNWSTTDSALRQDSGNENVRAITGNPGWTDYSITLKARKLGGNEGFLILFRMNRDCVKNWWNLGGWGNSGDGLEIGDKILDRTGGHIETGRWYDLRLNVKGNHIQCWLDGRLVHDLDYQPPPSLFASATLDRQSGDIIVKVVNVSSQTVPAAIDWPGTTKLSGTGTAIVLASATPQDENSLEQPFKVVPKTESVRLDGLSMRRNFAGNSVTVLRIGTK